jgi:di/tricarboxylate transporter
MELNLFIEIGWQGWLAIGTVLTILLLLIFTTLPADLLFPSGLGLLFAAGVLTEADALHGFASSGMITVGLLYIVVTGLQETGGLSWIGNTLLGHAANDRIARLKMMTPVLMLSAFLNNTPVVAMFIPVIRQWGKRIGIAPSRLMLPLSYASILGGICTLIGTSTNLVVNDMYMSRYHNAGLGMFDITPLGIACALAGTAYIVLFAGRLLPERSQARDPFANTREYSVEMIVRRGGGLPGKSVEAAGLRHLSGGYLVEIIRGDSILSPVDPGEILLENDRLILTGAVESILELRSHAGLTVATDQQFDLDTHRHRRRLVEVVVSNTCPLLGTTIRDGDFRRHYNAVVLAAARNGERIRGRIGDIVLHAGDTLLIESHAGFVPRQKDSRDFYLISAVDDTAPSRTERAPIAVSILVAMIASVTFGWLSMVKAAILAALAMIASRCCSFGRARQSIEWNVLIVIGSSLGLGLALEKTGAAKGVADTLIGLGGSDPRMTLMMVYVVTAIFTEVITNNAAAALVFPIGMNAAESLGANPLPFVMIVMIAASASFSTPIGYQTNLMVSGPGGYRFSDYLRIGPPLNLLVGTVSVILTPLLWPL